MTEFRPLQPTRDTDYRQDQKLAKKIKNFIYDPSDVIGSGFSSKVYKGINQTNNQQVAIKVIQLSKIQNQVQKYLLNNQINALRALNHKNILKTVDILMTKNNVYIVTEFCQFGDLQQMIKNNKKLLQKDALNIFRDIVEGYIAIQQKSVIHRDLKTANIFLTKTGAKIADFGFCQFIGQKKPQIAYNVGSPAYMSPQSYKQNFYSNKSDIWGIGIILCEMLIGQTPYKNLTYTQMSTNLMNGKINFTQNEDIRQILISCFRKDVRQRTDTKILLQNITKAIQKFNQGQKVDSRFLKNAQIVSNQAIHVNNFSNQQNELKLSTDNKKFISVSPSKLNNNQGLFEQGRQYSVLQPMSADHGSRTISGKKEGFNSSYSQELVANKNQQINNQMKKLKGNIMMLQFIFRLFKHMCDISIPLFSFIKLIIFRHRSYIDQSTDNLIQRNRSQITTSQLFKQFQFLKNKFDSAYLDKQNSTIQQGTHQIMNTMNKLANLNFIDNQCINAYKEIILKGCNYLITQLNQNRSNAYSLWDYLMLQFEILSLYGEGFSDQVIGTEKLNLQTVLKQQAKSISKVHIDLLNIKYRYLSQSNKTEYSQPQSPSSILYPQSNKTFMKHLSF